MPVTQEVKEWIRQAKSDKSLERQIYEWIYQNYGLEY